MGRCEPVRGTFQFRHFLAADASQSESLWGRLEVLIACAGLLCLPLLSCHTPAPAPAAPSRSSLGPCPSSESASTGRESGGRRTCHKEDRRSQGHGRRSVRRRDDRLRRQEPAARGRGAPQGASPRRARPAVLAAHQGRAPPRARDRHVLRAAGHGGAPGGPGCGRGRPRACAGDGAGRGGQGRGGAAHRGEEGAEAVRAADVPGGRRDVQPRGHVHGRRRRVLSLQLANGGRRGAGERDVGHVCALRRRGGRDGVLGAVGAPGAVARLPVAHARVAPPAARGPLRAQRRLRHRQRRAGHLPPRLRLLPPRPRARPMLRRGPRDYAVRHGLHVRPRRPGPPPLPGRPHRQRALLPPSGCRSQDTPHGQVRGRPVWALPGTKGAGGGWWPGRAGKRARANRPDHLMDFPWFLFFGRFLLISLWALDALGEPTTGTPEGIRFGCTGVDVGCTEFRMLCGRRHSSYMQMSGVPWSYLIFVAAIVSRRRLALWRRRTFWSPCVAVLMARILCINL